MTGTNVRILIGVRDKDHHLWCHADCRGNAVNTWTYDIEDLGAYGPEPEGYDHFYTHYGEHIHVFSSRKVQV